MALSKPFKLSWPWTPRNVEHTNYMLEELYKQANPNVVVSGSTGSTGATGATGTINLKPILTRIYHNG